MTKEITTYRNSDQYGYLVEHCQAILKTRVKNARLENILAYAEMGEEIVENDLYKKFGKGNQEFLRSLFEDIGISPRSGYYAIDFYENFLLKKIKKGEYEDVCTGVQTMIKEYFKEGENISWNKIKENYLTEPKQKEIPLPKGKYEVILADPPWAYRNIGVEGAAEKEYPTMPIEELCKMPIKELTGKNAVLFLWTTNPILEECFEVVKNWGFQYKTNICWLKKNKKTGIGFYVRGVHELLLICIKGEMLPEFVPLSVIEEESKRHSQKPEIYNLIEKMYPKRKYIELFARDNKKRQKWSYWGDEANI